MSILKILVILLILYLVWKYFLKKENLLSNGSEIYNLYSTPVDLVNEADKYYTEKKNNNSKSYMEMITNNEIDKETAASHYKNMVKQSPIYSSGAGYSVIEEDNTSPTFTNYNSIFKPEYVKMLPNPRQIYSENIDILKENTRPIQIGR